MFRISSKTSFFKIFSQKNRSENCRTATWWHYILQWYIVIERFCIVRIQFCILFPFVCFNRFSVLCENLQPFPFFCRPQLHSFRIHLSAAFISVLHVVDEKYLIQDWTTCCWSGNFLVWGHCGLGKLPHWCSFAPLLHSGPDL